MIRKTTITTLVATLATLIAWTASAEDATCTCVCDNGAPDWACTVPPTNSLLGGGTSTILPPMPDSCASMDCSVTEPDPLLGGGTGGILGGGTGDTGGGDTGGGDTGGILGGGISGTGGDTGGDSADDDVIPSPVAGYDCKRRSIYRPDLKKHKVYKVCRPALSDEQRAMIAAHYEKMKAKRAKSKGHRHHGRHKGKKSSHGHKHRNHGGD